MERPRLGAECGRIELCHVVVPPGLIGWTDDLGARPEALGGPVDRGGHPSRRSEETKKPQLLSELQPRDLVCDPASCVRWRVTSVPILRTAGPPAHTHVPGDLGVSHGP